MVCYEERLSVDGMDLQGSFSATSAIDVKDLEGEPAAPGNTAKLRVREVPEERVDTKDFKITSIAKWSVGYGNQFYCSTHELDDVPTEQGQQRVYPLSGVSFDFVRRPVTVTNTVTGATREVAVLRVNDRFVGWAHGSRDALVLVRSGRPTMFVFDDTSGATPTEIALTGRHLQFLDGERFLAAVYTSNPCSGYSVGGPLVRFFDDNGQPTEDIGWVTVPAGEAMTLEVYSEDPQTWKRTALTSTTMPDLGGWQGGWQHDVAISPDGAKVFFTLKVRDEDGTIPFTLHYLLALDEGTISLVDPSAVSFLSQPPTPSNTSFSGSFSTAVPSRQWNGSLTITLKRKDEGFLFGSDQSTLAERLTYSYELQLTSDAEALTETGEFRLGYREPYCTERDT